MAFTGADPARFQPYRESLVTTVRRTGIIALVLGSIAAIGLLRRMPSSLGDWYLWFVLVLAVGWISFGGHWVELAYLNVLRPRVARLPDGVLMFVRIGVWLIGGSLLFLGSAPTRSVLTAGHLPDADLLQGVLLLGGPVFVGAELVVHSIAFLLGQPSFWNGRG